MQEIALAVFLGQVVRLYLPNNSLFIERFPYEYTIPI